jgi:hypothetical protein
VGIALRRRADAPYMRRLQYLPRYQQLSIENDAPLYVVGPHLRILSYHERCGSYPNKPDRAITFGLPTVRLEGFLPPLLPQPG